CLIEVNPRSGENNIRHEDIESVIGTHNDEIALVMFGGVNYYTGQAFDIARITKAAHAVGAFAGFDLAHSAGNIDLYLSDS
ncbi:aminotransferase class V-fold PLP-dependent enzyme, partial [Vibrio sp. Vb2736]|uniref:aminotransferase class V-fold PLP-dependent enzyme n=1 Tax=Vibrio sp. Vb2736 TaxID=2816075 RepID=UPI001A8CA03A